MDDGRAIDYRRMMDKTREKDSHLLATSICFFEMRGLGGGGGYKGGGGWGGGGG